MVATAFSFGTEQFNRIFPFYILVDSDMKIASTGRSLNKLYPIKFGQNFTDCFQVKLPNIGNPTFDALKKLNNQVLLTFKGAGHHMLRGQFEYLDAQNQVIFIGTPRFNSMEEIGEE